MPYYHAGCNGRIKWYLFLPIRPRCLKCGHTWHTRAVYSTRPPLDLYHVFQGPKLNVQRGTTPYASWADSNSAPPGVAMIASHLPNWPRKWRITAFFSVLFGLSGVFYGLYLIAFGQLFLVLSASLLVLLLS